MKASLTEIEDGKDCLLITRAVIPLCTIMYRLSCDCSTLSSLCSMVRLRKNKKEKSCEQLEVCSSSLRPHGFMEWIDADPWPGGASVNCDSGFRHDSTTPVIPATRANHEI